MSRARELGKLANKNSLTADNTNNFVGIGSTQPDARLDVDGTVLVGTAITLGGASGIVSATSFYGDGSNLDGVASAGLGTALAEEGVGSVIYYTDNILGIGSTMVVTVPTGSDVAYTQYAEVSLDENVDLIVSSGDDFIPDILGLSTTGIVTTAQGAGGRIRAGSFVNQAGTGAPQLTLGAEIPVGYGLTGAGGINVSGAATIGGNLNVGGVLTYEDVTNIDSVGIITARSDVSIADKIIHTGDTNTAIRFPAADTFTVETAGTERVRVSAGGSMMLGLSSGPGTLQVAGGIRVAGSASPSDTNSPYIYRTSGADNLNFATSGSERLRITSAGAAIFKGGLAEKYENAGTTLGAQTNQPLSDGNVILFTGNESGNKTINFTGVHSTLSNGETVSFTAIITPNNSGKITVAQVDGQAITIKWSGGSAPSAGSSGQDIYTFQILKTGTGTSDYTVFGAAANYA